MHSRFMKTLNDDLYDGQVPLPVAFSTSEEINPRAVKNGGVGVFDNNMHELKLHYYPISIVVLYWSLAWYPILNEVRTLFISDLLCILRRIFYGNHCFHNCHSILAICGLC